MEKLLQMLLSNYIAVANGILGATIVDRDGLTLASESKGRSGDDSVIGALSAVIDSYIERIKTEFGTANNFCNITSTGDKKFAYCSQGPNSILTTVADPSISDTELRVYSEHIAFKIEQLIEGNDAIELQIPEIIRAIAQTKGGKLPQGEFSTKLIVTGSFSVGKTSLIKRFVENRFQESYIATIGVEISKKTLKIGETTEVNFVLWDIGGQIKQLGPYRARFYSGANAAFIVLDRSRSETLKSIETWYNDIKKSVPQKIPIIIVGNKSDIEDLYVSEDDIKKIAEEFGFHYILTSAKTGAGVSDAFLYCAFKYLEKI